MSNARPFACFRLIYALGSVLVAASARILAQDAQPAIAPSAPDREGDDFAARWPVATQTARPWTWWLWMGNVMDLPNLQRQLRGMRDAGLGGVTIYPFYGAKGFESRFIDFLSPRWMQMFAASLRYAGECGMGVDLNPVGGFPAGGPWVTKEDASSAAELRRYTVGGGGQLEAVLPRNDVRYLLGVGPNGVRVDLTGRANDGFLDWTAPEGTWELYAIVQRQPVQKVKRPAPGGAGYIVDPFSVKAMDHYLARFDQALRGYHGPPLRAQFQDSWEQITALTESGSIPANWTNDFFAEFSRCRGYDLRSQVPAFFGQGDPDTVARVRYDYRETINRLHQASTARWTEWSHAHGSLTRYQAHCSPSNIEDTYALPSTFRKPKGPFSADLISRFLFMKFPHRRPLTLPAVGSPRRKPSPGWASISKCRARVQLKPIVDRFFLAGINHIVLSSGVPNTPADVPWPGWMIYWAPDFGPDGGLWHDLPAFDAYATRCQSILQSGFPANDILLYFPMADFWQKPGEKMVRRRPWDSVAMIEGGLLPYESLEEEAPALEFQHVGNWNGKGWGPGFIEGSAYHQRRPWTSGIAGTAMTRSRTSCWTGRASSESGG